MKESYDLLLNSTIFSHHKTYNDLVDQVQIYTQTSGLDVRLFVFTSKIDPFKYFIDPRWDEFKIEQYYYENNIFMGSLIGKDNKNKINGKFLLYRYENTNIYFILTNKSRSFVEHGLLKFIKYRYPTLSLPFFYSWEIELMLNNLAKACPQYNLMLTKMSKKSRIENKTSRKLKESALTWTDLPYKEVFNQIRQSNAWVEKIYFDLVTMNTIEGVEIPIKKASGSIARNGVFHCNKEFKIFNSTIIERAVDVIIKKNKRFDNRARTKELNYEGKPIFIEFEEPIFKNKTENHKLLEVLGKFPHSAYSVIHKNPYLHATVTDYLDNSNYEIWILSDNRISIVPQTVCNATSLSRFCDHISKEFKEGTEKELSEIK